MKILADENIAGIDEWCGKFGEIALFQGRYLDRRTLRDADILLVRSVTSVDRALLDGTPVRFVGTATAGIDHIDTAYLTNAGIAFADAPGCNARAVAEYVFAVVLLDCAARARSLTKISVGIVGFGHVGQQVAGLFTRCGVRCVINDPPRARWDSAISYAALDEVLKCEVVTLHVPLTADGADSTLSLIDSARLAALSSDTLLINAARGGIVDEAALNSRTHPCVALDCWVQEPTPHQATLARAWLASPHIAGHTIDARWRATGQLAQRLAEFLHESAPPPPAESSGSEPLIEVDAVGEEALRQAVLAVCDPRAYSAALVATMGLDEAARGLEFDRLRKRFGVRREFSARCVRVEGRDAGTCEQLRALGFSVAA